MDELWNEYESIAGPFALPRDRFEAHANNELASGANMEKFLDVSGILVLYYEDKMLQEGYQGVCQLLSEYAPHLSDEAANWCNENPINGDAVVRCMLAAMEYPPPEHRIQQLLEIYNQNSQESASRSDDYKRIHMFLRKFSLEDLFEDAGGQLELAQGLAAAFFYREKWEELYGHLREQIREKHPQREIELAPLLNMINGRMGSVGLDASVHAANSTSTPDDKQIQAEVTAAAAAAAAVTAGGGDNDVAVSMTIPPVRDSIGSANLLHTTREDWLRKNAKIGKLYNQRSKGFCRTFELASISPGFRLYLTIWLFAGALQLYLYFLHFMAMVSWRVFVPVKSDYWHAVGYFCVLVALFFFIGPALTTVGKTLFQWVYVDDLVWYGSTDWSKEWLDHPDRQKRYDPRDGHYKSRRTFPGDESAWNKLEAVDAENPVPYHLKHVLPPSYRATIWGFPVTSLFPRSFLFVSLFVLTVPVPLIYAVVKMAIDGQSILSVSGYYCEWCVLIGLCVHIAVIIFTWSLGLATKYGEIYRHRKHNSEASRNGMPTRKITSNQLLMSELALDAETVMNNLAVFLVTYATIMILYWLTSTSEVEFPMKWIVTVLVSFLLLLVIREVLRDDHLATRVALLVLTLVVAFEIFGIVATVQISTSTLVVFLVLVVFSQGLLASHRAKPMINVDPLLFSAAVSEKCKQLLEHSNPRDEGKVPMSKVQSAIKKVANKTGKTSHKQPSWVPASNVIAAILRWNPEAVGEPFSPLTPALGLKTSIYKPNRFWSLTPEYYGGEAFGDIHNNPRRKIQQQTSVRVLFWFLIVFVISSGMVLASASYYKQETPVSVIPLGTVGQYNYPVCAAQFGSFDDLNGAGFTISDMAYLSYVGYISSASQWDEEVTRSIFNAGIVLIPSTGNLNYYFDEELGESANPQTEKSLINWVHVRRYSTHVIIVKSNLVGEHLMRDLDIWGDSVLYKMLSHVFPLFHLFTTEQKQNWVSGFASLKESLDNKASDHYFGAIIRYIESVLVTFPDAKIMITGHGTNGGIAKIVGSLLNIKSIAFGSPGTSFLKNKLSLYSNPKSLTVIPDGDQSCAVDQQEGAVQHIECVDEDTCHDIDVILAHLRVACGEGIVKYPSSTPIPPTEAPSVQAPTPTPTLTLTLP